MKVILAFIKESITLFALLYELWGQDLHVFEFFGPCYPFRIFSGRDEIAVVDYFFLDLCAHFLSHFLDLILLGLNQVNADIFAIEMLDMDVLGQPLVFLDSSFLLDLFLRFEPAGVDLSVKLFDLIEVNKVVIPCSFFLWLHPDRSFFIFHLDYCFLLLFCLLLAHLYSLPQIHRILIKFWLFLLLILLSFRKNSARLFGLERK